MKNFKELIKQVRDKWEFKGDTRPDFAVTPSPGKESVWDYPRPPVTDPDNRQVTIKYKDIYIADTNQSVRVLETASPPVFYIPTEDINTDFLVESSGGSFCEWKGEAIYWSFENEGEKLQNIGWSYPNPFMEFRSIKNYIAFYPSKVECYVDSERVDPQPGHFYGGWVTSEIVGPFKGEKGTEWW